MITWITGNSGAGKTRLAKSLQAKYGGVILDGEDMRRCWDDVRFTKDDRWKHNIRIAQLAKIIDNQGIDVIVATICPYKELRDRIKMIINCRFIYLDGGKPSSKEYPYELVG